MRFTGDIIHFAVAQIGLALLLVITFGLTMPIWFYWTVKYFIEHTEAE